VALHQTQLPGRPRMLDGRRRRRSWSQTQPIMYVCMYVCIYVLRNMIQQMDTL
jgi:hypothetical protein